MNRIDQTFAQLRREGRKALIVYLAAGYPRLEKEEKLILALIRSGVDVLELGIPFSDPIADGPTIQWASQTALKNGITISKILHLVQRLRQTVDIPILLMSYINPILNYRPARFFADAARAGIDGLIVPDLIPEESGPLKDPAQKWNVRIVHFVAPTSNKKRQRFICRASGGFIYAVSVTGVTGARKEFPRETLAMLKSLRRLTRKPIALGFGVSGPESVRKLLPFVDGVIVGSRLIETLKDGSADGQIKRARRFLAPLRKALGAREEDPYAP